MMPMMSFAWVGSRMAIAARAITHQGAPNITAPVASPEPTEMR